MSVIEGLHLTKGYGALHAIQDLSFTIEANTITGLIGRNGAGKTTLLKLIAGHLRPTQGELKVFGQKPFDNLAVAGNMIFVSDSMTFPDSFTLLNILKEVADFYPNWSQSIAQGLFDYFQLNPHQRYSNLSKGSKSTFQAIIGIASRCPLTLMDEPTTGMDSAVRKDFYRALLKDYIEHPRTVILSSHLLGELEDILEDILLLDQGTKKLQMSTLDMKQYALGFRGNAQAIEDLLQEHLQGSSPGEGILRREEFAKGSLYVVVKAEHLVAGYERIRQHDVEVVPIALDDLCIYLTAKTKGGIDDVFKRG
ncbi:ABC-type multidrug transport system, ATPase component [Desulfitobacterium dichloroeliminans LMG P-21439]|uniref:ABC-type multidrug transport system, ATPase component n=1 Tax=Desulfitobacterium dichloroeliminans (strain LMG P-21439 / DCA1) TaxID=871963 RepID=L0F3Y8_DESDL|nr:ABC transporter ATP-binding protein [Desulfitobacterium dichloroeliminans]AGA67892.1 ABC-type multidrug transport system, ATPase component [Desulfitobacterium dichloroeliminans LMG P-21439]